ncbi:hypothetical protein MXB_3957, partial [Myxobolus squamalis]
FIIKCFSLDQRDDSNSRATRIRFSWTRYLKSTLFLSCNGYGFIPLIHFLMTRRSKLIYCIVLHELVLLLDYRWMLSAIIVVFEKWMINIAKY